MWCRRKRSRSDDEREKVGMGDGAGEEGRMVTGGAWAPSSPVYHCRRLGSEIGIGK